MASRRARNSAEISIACLAVGFVVVPELLNHFFAFGIVRTVVANLFSQLSKLRFQLVAHFGVGGIVVDVVQFSGIFDQVIQLPAGGVWFLPS